MNHLDEMTLFTTLVEKGSLSAAAKALQTSVSTVSRHLFSLEKRLNTRLLTRTTRKLVPTETGRLYYEHARRILEEIRDMETLLDIRNAVPSGHIRISLPTLFGRAHIFPRLTGHPRRPPRTLLHRLCPTRRHPEMAIPDRRQTEKPAHPPPDPFQHLRHRHHRRPRRRRTGLPAPLGHRRPPRRRPAENRPVRLRTPSPAGQHPLHPFKTTLPENPRAGQLPHQPHPLHLIKRLPPASGPIYRVLSPATQRQPHPRRTKSRTKKTSPPLETGKIRKTPRPPAFFFRPARQYRSPRTGCPTNPRPRPPNPGDIHCAL